MFTQKVKDALNQQIGKESYSSALYLAMASWAEVKGYKGTSAWLYDQSEEERRHMLKIIRYVNERGGQSIIPDIDKPPVDYNDIHKLFRDVLEHEKMITDSINQIVGICIDEKDFTTHNWIQWFVNEQIEEEASVNNILDRLQLIGDGNLYLFDRDIMALRGSTRSEAN